MKLSLLSVGADAKTVKGESFGWLTAILYLAPAREAGRGNVCPNASAGCLASCLYSAGRGAFSNVQSARVRKTRLFFDDFATFKSQLFADIRAFVAHCNAQGKQACVRLNGTSDIAWEKLGVFEAFPSVRFYDYTKSASRAISHALQLTPRNYHLTFSRSEANEADALRVLRAGGNVAVVFGSVLPATWQGFPVVNGDTSDLRFLDGQGVVVGLKAKGKARNDSSGFVVS